MENVRMFSRKGMLIVIAAVACAASQPKPASPWRLDMATSGGFAGRGIGSAAIDSEGNVSVTTMSRKSCTYQASGEELTNVERLLASSEPAKWGDYVPENKCCDRIEYELTYDEAGRKYVARWITEPLPMPEDLKKVSEALDGLRQKYGEQCK
jgi:hypothetical protein